MKIYLDTIGCRLNQAEIERYARQFRNAGHTLVASPEEADLAVVNTCAVTAAAVADSRQKVRQVARLGAEEVVVTGCWATLKPVEAAAMPNVRRVVLNHQKDDLVGLTLDLPAETFDLEPVDRQVLPGARPPLPGARQVLPGARQRTRLFVKVQDGCDNRCTFCLTTLLRGPGRSRPIPEILADIHAACDVNEIVLTGVHLGSWGQDLPGGLRLQDLVRHILEHTAVPRLRLSSLEPWDLDAGFFRLWQDPRLCPHLHLPLQSGSAGVLRRMARKTTPASFARLVAAARSVMPEVAITTDLIVGFPGESQAEFDESLEFVQSLGLAGGHVFTYSARPGTAAARMPDQVPLALRKERNARMRAVFAQAAQAYQSGFVGRVLPVLWETASSLGPQGWEMSGLTGNYLRVNAYAPRGLWNQITPVRLTGQSETHLHGTILPG
jgi:threonylcarbamoyladenosine tRNA methylthiotransferase MtaB